MKSSSLFGCALALLSIMTGCSEPASRASAKQGVQLSKLVFPTASSGLSVAGVVNRYRSAFNSSYGMRAAVLAEYEWQSDTSGTYSLQPSYSTLAAFVQDLNSQSAHYSWSIKASDVLVVHPANSAYLSSVVGPKTYNDVNFCSLSKQLWQDTYSNTAASGCGLAVVGASGYVELPSGIISVTEAPTAGLFSVQRTESTATVVDYMTDAIHKASGRFSATGARSQKQGPIHWEISL